MSRCPPANMSVTSDESFVAQNSSASNDAKTAVNSSGWSSVATDFKIDGKYMLHFRDHRLESLYEDHVIELCMKKLHAVWVCGTSAWAMLWVSWFAGMGRSMPLSFTAPCVCLYTLLCAQGFVLLFLRLAFRMSHKWTGPEAKIVMAVALFVMLLPMSQLHRAGVLFANDRNFFHGDDYPPSDVLLLLTMLLVTQSCFHVSVRCSRLWPLPIACVLAYSFFSLPMLSPHQKSETVSVVLLVVVFNFLLFKSRHKAEAHDRENWCRIQELSEENERINLANRADPSFWWNTKSESLLNEFALALEERNENDICSLRQQLLDFGFNEDDIQAKTRTICKRLSEEAGVSVSYLMSREFETLAQRLTGKEDPTFYDMKDAFFFEGEIGKHAECPRDGRKGCALIDTLPFPHRRKATHFLSWLWQYKLSIVRSSLAEWLHAENLVADEVFLYMCFFVNNQYRILVDGVKVGSDSLGLIFESHLRRTGKVIAILEGWRSPSYLSRIWTIFEQFTAISLGIPVTMIMPQTAASTLISEFERGRLGILEVRDALSHVDSSAATASVKEDEISVKQFISSGVGFDEVNAKLASFMTAWVASQLQSYMDHLVHDVQHEHDVARSSRLFKL